MKLIFFGFVIFSLMLMVSIYSTVLAQSSPPLVPTESIEPTPQFPPMASDIPNESSMPQPSAKVNASPTLPSFPPIIIPMLTEPTPMPLPSTSPRPAIPLFFQVHSSPSPVPSFREVPSFELMTYRSIVAPALSFVTQTNVDQFYRDDKLPERTANLIYAISLSLMALGVWLSAQDLISETVEKLKRKELVQYGN